MNIHYLHTVLSFLLTDPVLSPRPFYQDQDQDQDFGCQDQDQDFKKLTRVNSSSRL